MLRTDFKPQRQLSEAQKQLFDKMMNEVKNSRYKAVSFKFEDTLVIHPFSGRNDMFTFMEEEYSGFSVHGKKTFAEQRIAAEEAAVKKYGTPARVTLKKIYDIFAKLSGVSPTGRDRLMERECELAEFFYFPRECTKALFREAKNNNKRVIIAAETIYPEATVKRILETCGYGSYDGLVMVSGINNCTSESYYAEVLKKAGTDADRLLHIGGDVAFDVEPPIIKGSKALLIASPQELMAKSGRVRGYAEEKDFFGFDDAKYMKLRCAFGIYSAYGFDTPQNKTALSDFCEDAYMLGFLVLGPLSFIPDFKPSGSMQTAILEALEKNENALSGCNDFKGMYKAHFGEFTDKYAADGCDMPLDFVEKCCASADRKLLEEHISADIMKKWSRSVKEPDIVPFSKGRQNANPLSKLADKMFPPDTKVRNIVDGILAKGKRHSD